MFTCEWSGVRWEYLILYKGRVVATRASGGAALSLVEHLNALPVGEALAYCGIYPDHCVG